MKRFAIDLTSKSMVTTEDNITVYETWLNASHASYTLERYCGKQFETLLNKCFTSTNHKSIKP